MLEVQRQIVLPEGGESAPIDAHVEHGHGRAGAKAVFAANQTTACVSVIGYA
jgi:hypothetical protein